MERIQLLRVNVVLFGGLSSGKKRVGGLPGVKLA